jgi:hypothetical protein
MTPTKDKSSMPDEVWLQYNHGWGTVEQVIDGHGTEYTKTATINAQLDSVIEWCQYNIGIHDPMYPEWTKGHNSAYQDILTKLKEMRDQ